jgi:hypothetical protein
MTRHSSDYYQPGTCNTIDDETGLKVKMSDVRKRWDGAYVTDENWEERQPQDFPVIPSPSRVFQNSRSAPPIKVYTDPDKSTLGG